MLRHHTGSGRRPVIHTDWADVAAGVVAGTLDAVVRIGPATGGPDVWDQATEQMVSTPGDPVYDGPAQLTAVTETRARATVSAEDPVAVRNYEITLPVDTTDIDPDGHVVFVDQCKDASLVDRVLVVDSVVRGSRRFSRTIYAHLTD